MPDAAAEHDRDLDQVHVVDEAGSQEVADDRGATADPDVEPGGRLPGGFERLGRRGVEEVEGGAALHLDRGLGRWVSTNVGVWKGGFGPHQPFQSGSSRQPGGPNLLAPMISAPKP